MHLHWKYRELVKILVKSKSFTEVKQTALSLEAESGGILVSVDKVSKGYAIVVFRRKNYKRPSTLRPRNLLSKRKALARSIELQRHQVLFISYCAGFLKFSLVRCLKTKEQFNLCYMFENKGNRLGVQKLGTYCHIIGSYSVWLTVIHLAYVFVIVKCSFISIPFPSLVPFLETLTGPESSLCQVELKGGAAESGTGMYNYPTDLVRVNYLVFIYTLDTWPEYWNIPLF